MAESEKNKTLKNTGYSMGEVRTTQQVQEVRLLVKVLESSS